MSEHSNWRHGIDECERMPYRCNNCPRPHVSVNMLPKYAVYSAFGDELIGVFDNFDEARKFATRG